jgi:hypothetical protein
LQKYEHAANNNKISQHLQSLSYIPIYTSWPQLKKVTCMFFFTMKWLVCSRRRNDPRTQWSNFSTKMDICYEISKQVNLRRLNILDKRLISMANTPRTLFYCTWIACSCK